MQSLVADYGSSDEDSEASNTCKLTLKTESFSKPLSAKHESVAQPSRKKTRVKVDHSFFSVHSGDVESSSDQDNQHDDTLNSPSNLSRMDPKPSGLKSLFAMLPAPKKSSMTSPHTIGSNTANSMPSPRMLGQASGDGLQPGLMISQPISRISKITSTASKNIPVSHTKSSTASKSTLEKETEVKVKKQADDIDPDCFFNPGIEDSDRSSNANLSTFVAPLVSSSMSLNYTDSSESPVVGDYEAYAAQFSGYTSQKPNVLPPEDIQDQSQNVDKNGLPFGIDESVLLKLGHRVKKDGAVEIKEIHHADQMGNMHAMHLERNASLQGLPENASFSKLGSGVISQGMKRRHNIMSLAHEAKARQQTLEEQATNRKIMKKEIRSKYGF
ncbi:hypothetical protein QVD99_005402 [Batrachochytrium dendrobatidis]|nr:hypothetical protein QVD99_005402 [Batrachochytrium dendrobatidis]